MKTRRIPAGWTCYQNGGSDQNGEWQPSGTYTAKKVLWQGRSRYSDGNRVTLEIYISGRHASVLLKYEGEMLHLWSFKVRSNLQAIRKTEYRMRGHAARMVRAIQRRLFRRHGWFAAYREGVPFCSFYYHAYEITNGRGIPSGRYQIVTNRGAFWDYQIRGEGSITGSISNHPNPEFPNWITATLAA